MNGMKGAWDEQCNSQVLATLGVLESFLFLPAPLCSEEARTAWSEEEEEEEEGEGGLMMC